MYKRVALHIYIEWVRSDDVAGCHWGLYIFVVSSLVLVFFSITMHSSRNILACIVQKVLAKNLMMTTSC